jgi:hypothetical protein
MPAMICLFAIIAPVGCDGGAAPLPPAEYDEIKNDPELAAIASSGKGPKVIREQIQAKIRSRQRAAVADAKADGKKRKNR